jgi:hypothetical protein
MHDGWVIGKHARGAGKKAKRRELLEIRQRSVEILCVCACHKNTCR